MRYHVTTDPNGTLRDAEMATYLEVLHRLGHSTDREQIREPQTDGTVYLRGGRIGVVETEAEAEQIKLELEKELPSLVWRVELVS
ncbi:hypothetical protein WMF45_13640 [Sorangium sp. So ce448]|uniref:hypothetical protein n=1 Tax=Sorangium sp. So ce448 TaxID=3133314 RepID=UPI003F5D9C58